MHLMSNASVRKSKPIPNFQTRSTYDLLQQEKLLVIQGTGFNWPRPDHFRIVFLPHMDELREAIGRLAHFLDHYRQ